MSDPKLLLAYPKARTPPGLLRLRMELQRHQDLTPAEAAEAANLLVGLVMTLERVESDLAAMAQDRRPPA
ncbi:hypothetical protein [Falsiroseomonas sp. E2-1-a20]|uniref:hypothetical protein n=1 Tax=Falsiroseomonas sp. E2-1-a20 TaxID=3239300 RepID=UPI003F409E8C